MPVVRNAEAETMELPGLRHRTIAGTKQGLKSMEVWMQTIAPGAATPVHRHSCEEVVLILSGSGTCTVAGEVTHFDANTTLVLESDVVHQIVNTSNEEMNLIAVLGMAPVRVRTAEGEALALPWDSPEA